MSVAPPAAPLVLIIDDDEAIRVLSQWIVQRAGYRAITARDGPEGIELVKVHGSDISLILLDLTMPRMGGGEVAAELQRMGIHAPVVLVTGYGEEGLREDERCGVAGVLQKPFTPDILRTAVGKYLKRAV